jgi:hypothetical protein
MFHVITPLARFENIHPLIAILKPHNIQWHVITDDDNKTPLYFDEPWIHHYVCPNESIGFWARSNNSINWFLETQPIVDEDYYGVLNDDDGYENNFFQKLQTEIEENKPTDLIITSMKRGFHIPDNLPPVKQHPTTTLIATPENMVVCGVGVEQFFIKGKLLKQHRLPLTPYGDGELIVELVKQYETLYLPHLFVLFNYLEPGRWDKKPVELLPPPCQTIKKNLKTKQKKMPQRLQNYLKKKK